jgi:alpha-galactosidase
VELHIDRLEVTAGTVPDRPGGPPGADAGGTARPGGDGVVRAGALEVRFDPGGPAGAPSSWELANRGDRAVAVRSVAAVLGVTGSSGRLAMFRNGYQSWSACGTAVFGVDHDPSHDNTLGIEELQGAHHADQRRARPGELRSEMVTVLADGDGAWVAGFGAGTSHDGTFRLRDGAGGPELWCEAFLGDAVLAPGESRRLHPVEVLPAADPLAALDDWARRAGAGAGARTAAAYQVGWCSWYHYFHDVSEEVLRANLALAGDWPFDVFQLDDGFQSAIGDWLTTNDRFPTDLDGLAGAIAGAGRVPGIWIAPFLVAPDSAVARAHPDWIARRPDGVELLPGMFNPAWGGGLDGIMWTLDTTHPEVLDHLEHVARSLRQAGFPYLKLDFTYAPSFDGVFHDPSRTPAERVRAGYDAVRRGAGDDAFLLGCGAPLSHVVGVVDGNRIGSDVAPSWTLPPDHQGIPGYQDGEPATLHAFRNTLARSFLHRRLWLNDPDCLMLRTEDTALTPEAMRTWAHAVAVSGGMALVSDDLALLGPEARRLLDEVVAIGRVADEEARTGAAPRVPDLLEPGIPTTIEGGGHRLVTDPATAGSSLT